MKSTGVVRRIDDLGRIVLPKEIRKTLRIREGESLEIYTNGEEIVLKKSTKKALLTQGSLKKSSASKNNIIQLRNSALTDVRQSPPQARWRAFRAERTDQPATG